MQKFYTMIREIIVPKSCADFLLFFVDQFLLAILLWRTNHWNLNISRTIYLKKIFAHCFEDQICTNKLEEFFFQNFFFKDLDPFFRDYKTTDFGLIFLLKKKFSSFFQMRLFIFIIILNTWFKILFRRTVRNCWFYSFKHSNPTSYFKVYSNSLSC